MREPLTSGEYKICELAASGLSNIAIGSMLGIKPSSAGYVLCIAYSKLGINKRSQLKQLLVNGLVEKRDGRAPSKKLGRSKVDPARRINWT